MSNWTDKDTDKLFQRGSEQYDFEYNPAAWEQMARLLDKDRRRRLFFWWAIGSVAALLVVLGVFLLWADGKGEAEKHQLEQKAMPQEKDLQAVDFQKNNALPEKAPDQADSGDTLYKTGLGETGKQEQTPPNARRLGADQDAIFHETPSAHRELSQGIPGGTTTETQTLAPPTAAGSGSRNNSDGVPVPAETAVAEGSALVEDGGQPRPDDRAALLPGLTYLPALPLGIVYPQQSPGFILSTPDAALVGTDDHPRPQGSRLLFGLGGGPEFISVGFGDFSRLNWKYGLHLEYRYRGRFALGIGANYQRMSYVAGKGEFHLPATFPSLDQLVATRGVCKMVEVPLELGYFLGGYQKSGLFATIGVASYFMFNEAYDYDYTYFSPSHVAHWSTNENGNYWFGTGSVSLGYNRRLSDKLALRFAPYAQFPLQGVGRGEVRLFGIGANLRLDFVLVK